jgi:lipopolysaccharide export system protein LptA
MLHPSWLPMVLRSPLSLLLPATLAVIGLTAAPTSRMVQAQSVADGRSLTLRADVQEANAKTGIVTARGNVQINYPARQIQATSAQAQYFSRERRIVLTGNVYVLQQGNSMRGEVITYLIDEGRFVALPQSNQQVESTYLVNDPNPAGQPTTGDLGPAPFEPGGSSAGTSSVGPTSQP